MINFKNITFICVLLVLSQQYIISSDMGNTGSEFLHNIDNNIQNGESQLTINMSGKGIDDEQFAQIVQQIIDDMGKTSYTELYLNVEDNDISDITPLAEIGADGKSNLKVFQLFMGNNQIPELKKLGKFFKQQPKIEKMSLDFHQNPVFGAMSINQIEACTKLKELEINLSGENKSFTNIDFMNGISKLENLQRLHISLNGCNYQTCIQDIGVLWNFKVLDNLQYFGFEIEHQVYIQDYTALSFPQDSNQVKEIFYNLKYAIKDFSYLKGLQYSSVQKINIDASYNQGITGLNYLGKISKNAYSVNLDLSGNIIDNMDFLSEFQEAYDLQELHINLSQNQKIHGGQQLAYLKDLSNLKILDLNLQYNSFTDGEIFESLAQLQNIKELSLNLEMNFIQFDKDSGYFDNFKNMKNLESFSIFFSNNNKLTSLQFIEGISQNKNLKSLTISIQKSYKVSDLNPFSYINNLEKLEKLSIDLQNLYYAWDIRPFRKLTDLNNLKEFYLNVKGTDISSYDCEKLQQDGEKLYPDAKFDIQYSR